MKTKLLLLLLLASFCTAQAQNTHIYVSPQGNDGNDGLSEQRPLRTLVGARDAVRRLDRSTAVTVNFMNGIYPIAEPVVFESEDSGTSSAIVTYRAMEHGKAIFSGGQAITGWKKHKGNIWVTRLPEVAAGKWDFRQIYVNSQLRLRARTPNEGVFTVESQPGITSAQKYAIPSDTFVYSRGDVDPSWKNLTQGEAIVFHYWTDSHLRIDAIEGSSRTIRFKYPSTKIFLDGFEGEMSRYVIENIYETLDRPGEWVMNNATGQLFYIPMPGEKMLTAEIIAPRTREFMRIEGNASEGKFVEHLRFEGLSFSYSNFVLKEGDGNDTQAANTVSACVGLRMARNCAFEGCRFSNLGTYAVDVFEGCCDNELIYNVIEQVCAGGFRVRGSTPGKNPALRTGGNTIADNTIAHYGLYYASAVGILLMHSDDNDISHNLIHHGDYTGISIGWSWNYMRSAARNNRIEYNHIHHIGINNLLSDMGGIYTLGFSPGTVIRGNLIHDVLANQYGGWGIYNDEGSTSILIEDNVVYNTKFGMFNIHYAKDLVVRNNIFALGTKEQLSRDRVEPHVSVYFEGNIVYWKEGRFLAKDWSDKPYKTYFNYFQGWKDAEITLVSDWNLFYNPSLKLEEVDFNGMDIKAWRALGRDANSLYADPLFVDPLNGDFRLKPESPALKLGFKPLDTSTAGPRKENN